MKQDILTRLTVIILGLSVLAIGTGVVGVVANSGIRNIFMLTVFIGGGIAIIALILIAIFSIQHDISVNKIVNSLSERGELTVTAVKDITVRSRHHFSRMTKQSTSLQNDATGFVDKAYSIMQKNEKEMRKTKKVAEATKVSAQQSSEAFVDMQISAGQISASITKLNEAMEAIEDTSTQINALVMEKNDNKESFGEEGNLKFTAKVQYLSERMAVLSGAVSVILKDNIEKTKMQSDMAGDMRGKLDEIAEGSKKMELIADETAKDSHEQTQNVAAVIKGLGQIVRIFQQHTIEVKENVQIADELSGHVEILQEGVDKVSTLLGSTTGRAVKIESKRAGDERRGKMSFADSKEFDQKRLTADYFDTLLKINNQESKADLEMERG